MSDEPEFDLSPEEEAAIRRVLALAGIAVQGRLTRADLATFLALVESEVLAEGGMGADGPE